MRHFPIALCTLSALLVFTSVTDGAPAGAAAGADPAAMMKGVADLLKGMGGAGGKGGAAGGADLAKMMGPITQMMKGMQGKFSSGSGKQMMDSIKGLIGEEGKKKLAAMQGMAGAGGGADIMKQITGVLKGMTGGAAKA